MTRIQVSLGDRALELLDRYADGMGVTRSALCAVLIGQGLMNYNPTMMGNGDGTPDKDKEHSSLDETLANAKREAKRRNGEERTI